MNTKVLLSAILLITSGAIAQSQITASKIGSGPNVFNSGRPFLNQITVNNKTNTISFVHRTAVTDNTTKGCLSIDVSNNGGETWSLNKSMNLGTVIEGVNGARYPQLCLTNSGKQYVLAPSLSNNGWEGFYSGVVGEKSLIHNKTKNLFNLPASFISSDENTFWATDLIIKEGNSIGFKILKGNLQGQEINWENNLEYKISNCLDANNLPHIEQASAVAFSKDGKIGYAVFLAHINNCDVKQPQLIVFKTSTGGLNWSAPEIVDLTKINTNAKTVVSPAFELDAAVDSDNRLHLFTALFNSDGIQYINNFEKPLGLYDFVGEGNNWQAYKIADLQALRVYLGSGRTASQDNRLQLTQSDDRNTIGYIWVDSDTKIVGEGHNTIPNLFVKLIDFKNLKQSDVVNCTSGLTDFANQAFFPVASSTLMGANDNYELPVVLSKLNASMNENDEVTYHYLKGIKPLINKNFNPKNTANQDPAESVNFIYPNPAINSINLNIKQEEILCVNFYDATGAIVKTIGGGINNNIDISTLPAGVYLVKTQTAKRSIESKFVKGN